MNAATSNEWEVIGHAYLPIPFYAGKVAKYQGMVTPRNRAMLESAGCFILPERIADRIVTATRAPFAD
jgi:hypothetical protein